MKKEYVFFVILGLFLFAYLLDAVVNPLSVDLATPYSYFLKPNYITTYPFTSLSIFVKAIAIFITPLWLFSFFAKNYQLKGLILVIGSILMQLYALQDIVTTDQIVPIEWALAMCLSGVVLIIPGLVYLLLGLTSKKPTRTSHQPDSQHQKDSILLPD